jgi:hypothetical protein
MEVDYFKEKTTSDGGRNTTEEEEEENSKDTELKGALGVFTFTDLCTKGDKDFLTNSSTHSSSPAVYLTRAPPPLTPWRFTNIQAIKGQGSDNNNEAEWKREDKRHANVRRRITYPPPQFIDENVLRKIRIFSDLLRYEWENKRMLKDVKEVVEYCLGREVAMDEKEYLGGEGGGEDGHTRKGRGGFGIGGEDKEDFTVVVDECGGDDDNNKNDGNNKNDNKNDNNNNKNDNKNDDDDIFVSDDEKTELDYERLEDDISRTIIKHANNIILNFSTIPGRKSGYGVRSLSSPSPFSIGDERFDERGGGGGESVIDLTTWVCHCCEKCIKSSERNDEQKDKEENKGEEGGEEDEEEDDDDDDYDDDFGYSEEKKKKKKENNNNNNDIVRKGSMVSPPLKASQLTLSDDTSMPETLLLGAKYTKEINETTTVEKKEEDKNDDGNNNNNNNGMGKPMVLNDMVIPEASLLRTNYVKKINEWGRRRRRRGVNTTEEEEEKEEEEEEEGRGGGGEGKLLYRRNNHDVLKPFSTSSLSLVGTKNNKIKRSLSIRIEKPSKKLTCMLSSGSLLKKEVKLIMESPASIHYKNIHGIVDSSFPYSSSTPCVMKQTRSMTSLSYNKSYKSILLCSISLLLFFIFFFFFFFF